MATITVDYAQDGDDWAVTARCGDKTLSGKAPGLIAARDRADQLVDKLAGPATERTVVHMLDGDAYAFTTAYLHARHGLTGDETSTKQSASGGGSAQQLA